MRVLEVRHKKLFKCPNGHVGHADRNASVNVLIRYSAFRSMKLPNFWMWRLRRDEVEHGPHEPASPQGGAYLRSKAGCCEAGSSGRKP
ncbi:hypothetical protein DRP04_08750 [Archaeoglobales archaeon]|nr:MAG: hypothetical protein DRP04_08750 [Archaeoglobales archaeon]